MRLGEGSKGDSLRRALCCLPRSVSSVPRSLKTGRGKWAGRVEGTLCPPRKAYRAF